LVSTLRLIIIIVVAAVVLVGVVGPAYLFASVENTPPPVDLYARPTPSSSIEPRSLIPSSVVGQTLLKTDVLYSIKFDRAKSDYDGGITIGILKWSSVSQAVESMADVYGGTTSISTSSVDSVTRIQNDDVDWFSRTTVEESFLVWRKGQWTFSVRAPSEEIRDAVLQELRF